MHTPHGRVRIFDIREFYLYSTHRIRSEIILDQIRVQTFYIYTIFENIWIRYEFEVI